MLPREWIAVNDMKWQTIHKEKLYKEVTQCTKRKLYKEVTQCTKRSNTKKAHNKQREVIQKSNTMYKEK